MELLYLCTLDLKQKIMGLTNNDIFKKLRVAHKLTNDDIAEICELVDFKVSKSELGAIFRKEGHPKYMECGDQFLRNFLDGLIIYLRGPKDAKSGAKHPGKSKPATKSFKGKPGGKPKPHFKEKKQNPFNKDFKPKAKTNNPKRKPKA